MLWFVFHFQSFPTLLIVFVRKIILVFVSAVEATKITGKTLNLLFMSCNFNLLHTFQHCELVVFGSILFHKKTTVLLLSLLETLHAMRIICTIRYCSQYLLPLTNSRTITISGTYVTTTKYILYMNNEAKSLNLGCFEPNTE